MPKKILIIEDNCIAIDGMRTFIEAFGGETLVAQEPFTPDAITRLVENQKPDHVILDGLHGDCFPIAVALLEKNQAFTILSSNDIDIGAKAREKNIPFVLKIDVSGLIRKLLRQE
jgi:hypothetical protein